MFTSWHSACTAGLFFVHAINLEAYCHRLLLFFFFLIGLKRDKEYFSSVEIYFSWPVIIGVFLHANC